MVTGWPPGSGGWPRNAPAARPMALIAEVAGRQVIEERIETGRSQGRAPSGINPVVGFPTAGHLLGRAAHARCWLVAARAPQRPAETLLRYWHGLGGQLVQLTSSISGGSPAGQGRARAAGAGLA